MVSMSRRNVLGFFGAQSLLLAGRSAFGAVEPLSARGGTSTELGFFRHGDRVTTRLTREYGLTHPFVSAGMAFVAGPALASAVSNAGGLGTLGTGPVPAAGLDQLIRATRSMTSGPFAVDLINATSGMGPFTTQEHIDVCADHKVPVVVFFWNCPQRAWVNQLHAAGTRVWMQVGSVAEAVEAHRLGADAIICQGTGAGGHNKSVAPTKQLVYGVRAALGYRVTLLAAGGIVEGRDVAHALAHGADGVWVGTRMVASTEAYAHAQYKQRIVHSSLRSTARTTLFGPEWQGQPMRVLRNRVVNMWSGREDKVPQDETARQIIGTTVLGGQVYHMPKYSAIVPTCDTQGDFEEMCMPAGDGAPRIRRVQSAGSIIREMMTEASEYLA